MQINPSARLLLKATFFCFLFTGLLMAFSPFKNFFPSQYERLAYGTIGTFVAFLATFIFLRFDKKTWAHAGLRFEGSTVPNFFIGFSIGIALMGTMALGVIYASGFDIAFNSNSNILNFAACTLPLIPLAFFEELGFRAYPLQILKDGFSTRYVILFTSALFAIYHLANGWTIQNAFLGAGVWGIVYGMAAVYSKGISMPTGMHYAANLTTSAFGISDDSFNLWTLKMKDGTSIENYQSSELADLIPQAGLLILGIICMEWYVRKREAAPASSGNQP